MVGSGCLFGDWQDVRRPVEFGLIKLKLTAKASQQKTEEELILILDQNTFCTNLLIQIKLATQRMLNSHY